MTHPTKAIIPLMLEDARKIEESEGKKSTTQKMQNMGQTQQNFGQNMKSSMKFMQNQGVSNPNMGIISNIPVQQTSMGDYEMNDEGIKSEPETSMFEPSVVTKDMIARCIKK